MHNYLLGSFTACLGIAAIASGLYAHSRFELFAGLFFLGHGLYCYRRARQRPPRESRPDMTIVSRPKAGKAAAKSKPTLSKRPPRKGLFVG